MSLKATKVDSRENWKENKKRRKSFYRSVEVEDVIKPNLAYVKRTVTACKGRYRLAKIQVRKGRYGMVKVGIGCERKVQVLKGRYRLVRVGIGWEMKVQVGLGRYRLVNEGIGCKGRNKL